MRTNIMKITNIHSFLEDFFISHQCPIIHNEDGVLTIQLTEEMDKALMNRPFYWHYVKSTGHAGEPMKLSLITNPAKRDEKGEWIHFGSPRLQQIFNYLKMSKNNIKLFQKVNTLENTALFPWLITNIKINYNGKHNKSELFSIGLNLINGHVNTNMIKVMEAMSLRTVISEYCYIISPLIKLQSGYKRIERIVDEYITRQAHEWAAESINTLHEEKKLVEHFYDGVDDTKELKEEIADLTKRFAPTISYQVINGGLAYLTAETN